VCWPLLTWYPLVVGSEALLIVVVITALAFDFTNGFHDTANAMATTIATGALRPRVAVALSALLNFVGAFISIAVATTIAKDIVSSSQITLEILFAALLGAILWNLVTWAMGLPSSSSHAIIGGLVGATWVAEGSGAVDFTGVFSQVLIPALIAPLLAGGLALIATFVAYRLRAATNEERTDAGYKLGQIGSASLVSLAHGTNDAQKTMGVITLALIAHGSLDADNFSVPVWVKLAAASSIALGTYIGGWRIIRTLGHRLTGDIESPQGFSAESSTAATILASSYYGFPLSTTQVVSGSVVGSGLGKRLAQVRWGVAGQIAIAWLFTLPMAGAVGALAFKASALVGGTAGSVVIAFVGAAAAAALYVTVQRRSPVTADNVNDEPGTTRITPRERSQSGPARLSGARAA
jgi:PiT family inorganic phosphate transporter